jgi:hypothetical protein
MKSIGLLLWTIMAGVIFWRANVVAPGDPGLAALQQLCGVLCVVLGLLTMRGER